MELRQLRYFIVLAEELHFARAAARLGIAQPSLSVQIQTLEATLSTKLLSRDPRSVQLTSAGAIFLEEARLTLAQADRAVSIGRRAGRGELGSIRIAMALASTLSGVPSMTMARFRRRYPEVDFQVSIKSTNPQLESLLSNKLDVGFLVHPSTVPDELELVSLCSEQLMVAMSVDDPLASHASLEAADLADQPFLVVHPEVSSGIYECTLMVARHGRFVPRIIRFERDLVTLLSLVGAGFGMLILSESVQRLAVPYVAYRPLRGGPTPIEIAAVFRRDESGVPVRAFIDDILRDAAERHARTSAPDPCGMPGSPTRTQSHAAGRGVQVANDVAELVPDAREKVGPDRPWEHRQSTLGARRAP